MSCACKNTGNVQISNREEQIYRDVFNMFDHDPKDGEITANELRITMVNLGLSVTISESLDIINELDHDQNQKIDFNEFCKMMGKHHHHCIEKDCRQVLIDDLQRAFHLFDLNGNGFICKDELREILIKTGEQDVSEAEIDEILKLADTDCNGMICFDEFVRIITHE